MANEPIPVGVFTESGGAHLDAYFQALAEIEECGGVALCDPSGESVALARRHLGEKLAAVFAEPSDLLREAAPTLAVVSLEAVNSPPVIRAALEAGCHVFAEKPACVRAEDFEALVVLAEARDRHLMLALANRLTPAVRRAQELVAAGALGELYGVEMHLVADQTRLTREAYHSTWFADRERAGGGHLAWLGIHWLDLAMLISGREIAEIFGFTGIVGGQPLKAEDAAALAFRFDNGALGTMVSAYFTERGYHSHLRLWGSKGWIDYGEWKAGERSPDPLTWESSAEGQRTEGVASFEGPHEPRGYTPCLRACVLAAMGRGEPPVTGRECLRVLRTVFGAYEAAERGAVVALPRT